MRHLVLVSVLGVVATSAGTLRAQIPPANITADDVNDSIARAVRFLKSQQKPDGSWPDRVLYRGGLTPLCTLALLNAGYGPDDPAVAAALKYLRAFIPESTYTTSLQTMVFCAAEPDRDRLLIVRNVQWLESRQIKDGASSGMWAIPTEGTTDHTDNSMTHFAMLALHEAERQGISATDETWRLALGHWQRSQNVDGSWGWGPTYPGTGSMTTAGIAAIIMATGRLDVGDVVVRGEAVDCCGDREPNRYVDRGLAWMAEHFSVTRNPGVNYWASYYLYSLERAGRLTARRFIGNHDWYREGTRYLVRAQLPDGSWPSDLDSVEYAPDPSVSASFMLMFLAKGRRPVVLAELLHAPQPDVRRYPSALFNLVGHLEKSWKRDLTYQQVNLAAATVEDLLETPMLLLRGRDAPQLSTDEKQKLRMYLDRGGFLFAEQCCGGGDFDAGFRRLVDELYPEGDSKLTLLPVDHPIWFAERPVAADGVRELWGLDSACRTAIVYSPHDLSCYWELAGPQRGAAFAPAVQAKIDAAVSIGMNVAAYATNREVKYKNPASPTTAPPKRDAGPVRGKLYVANVIHPGGCRAAPTAWQNLLRLSDERLGGHAVGELHEITLIDPALFDHHLVFIHGRTHFTFTPVERQQLRLFVERGGMVFADAVCSSREFAESFRREMQLTLPESSLARVPDDDPLFTPAYGGADVTQVDLRRPDRAGEQGPLNRVVRRSAPVLEAVKFGERYVVLFSPYDVSCALENQEPLNCDGYSRAEAARLALNVLLYSLH